MFYTYIDPSPLLAPFVRYYWVLEIGATEGEITERVIPTGAPQILFHYGTPFVRRNNGSSERQPRSFLSGISGGYDDISSVGDSGVIAVTFHPFGAAAFFPFPQCEAEDRTLALPEAGWSGAAEIEEQIAEALTLAGRIAIIEKHLVARLRPPRTDEYELVRRGVAIVRRRGGSISTGELAGSLFCSPKTLERRFSLYLGKTPKQFSRIIRFQEAVRHLSQPGAVTLTECSQTAGYYDQSHFINDFRQLSGYTPGEFLSLYACEDYACVPAENGYRRETG